MSYSFNVTGATKEDVLVKIVDQLNLVVLSQPAHSIDQSQALAAATIFLNLSEAKEGKDIVANVNGHVWNTESGLQAVGFGINISYTDKKVG